jgi:hypothetical protein
MPCEEWSQSPDECVARGDGECEFVKVSQWIELPNKKMEPGSGAACAVQKAEVIDHELHDSGTCQAACDDSCVAIVIRADGECVTCSYADGSTSFETMDADSWTVYMKLVGAAPVDYPADTCGAHAWGEDRDGRGKCGNREPYDKGDSHLHETYADDSESCCKSRRSTEEIATERMQECKEPHLQAAQNCLEHTMPGVCKWDTSITKECADASPDICDTLRGRDFFSIDQNTGIPLSSECLSDYSVLRAQCAMSCNEVCVAAGNGLCMARADGIGPLPDKQTPADCITTGDNIWVPGCPEHTFCEAGPIRVATSAISLIYRCSYMKHHRCPYLVAGTDMVGECIANTECAELGVHFELCMGHDGDEPCTVPSREACGTPVMLPTLQIFYQG